MKSLRPFLWTAGSSVLALGLGGCETVSEMASASDPPLRAVPAWTKTGEVYHGKMSWYSVRTNGGTRTASGEKLRDDGDTAAHRTLPFGTLVEVTNLSNQRSEILRITDRGPFKRGRVLDVSIGAAKKLGFDKNGLAECRVEVLQRSPDSTEGGSEPQGGE